MSRGQPALPPSLGIMAGGALLQGRGAGRTEYRFLEKGASPHWSLVWTMHVNPRWVLTWEETQSLTEEEFQLLRDEGRPPGRLREPMLQRAGQQRLEAADEGLLPERYGDPVHQAVIASTEWAGLPYGQGPAIAVHGVPVVIAGPQQDDGRVYGSLAVSASAALYRPGSLWAPVDPRHPGQPENGTPARMTDVQFETGLTTGHPPVMTTPQITLSAQVNGEGITLEAPFVITGDSLAELGGGLQPRPHRPGRNSKRHRPGPLGGRRKNRKKRGRGRGRRTQAAGGDHAGQPRVQKRPGDAGPTTKPSFKVRPEPGDKQT